MTSPPSKRRPGSPVPAGPGARHGGDWDHTVGLRLFRTGRPTPEVDDLPALRDVDGVVDLPGYVFQAARSLAGLSQQGLRDASTVSKKVINDFENGFVRPKPALVERMAVALRDHGARFVRGEGTVGVVVVLTRPQAEANSRSPARKDAVGGADHGPRATFGGRPPPFAESGPDGPPDE